ncbi:MAG TPA: pentapeptide repeat-containing protein [Actinophytocola sp.]|uniref:pentapeptide repeat-containing protein n=1 Tax=Actinophytocola sp. TaxID=1872138 RepID=UPI002F93B211
MNVVFFVVGALTLAGGIGVWSLGNVFGRSNTTRENMRLGATILFAVATMALVAGWLLTGTGVDRGEALKTGGLAGGAVVALYALWLNDRRRRVDEERKGLEKARQDLESERAEHDRKRAADERFLRAVELLGADADQVRVGALHALAGLARGRPEYTQDVLDVICSYLRRPFDHYRHAARRGETTQGMDRAEADRWLQVRLTAQRLIADLLPDADSPDPKEYDLDLHGATLEYFDVSGKVIGQLRARELNLYESNSFHHCEFRKHAWFTGSRSWGRLYAHDTTFHQKSWFSRFTAHDFVDFANTAFHGDTKFASSTWDDGVSFRDAVFDRNVDFTEATFSGDLDLRVSGDGLTGRTIGMTVSLHHRNHLPPGWRVDTSRDEERGLVRS